LAIGANSTAKHMQQMEKALQKIKKLLTSSHNHTDSDTNGWIYCSSGSVCYDLTNGSRLDKFSHLINILIFTKLGLSIGYYHIRLNMNDIHEIAFWTHNGHYKYMVMPFGLFNIL
jgi:hypothetical protein